MATDSNGLQPLPTDKLVTHYARSSMGDALCGAEYRRSEGITALRVDTTCQACLSLLAELVAEHPEWNGKLPARLPDPAPKHVSAPSNETQRAWQLNALTTVTRWLAAQQLPTVELRVSKYGLINADLDPDLISEHTAREILAAYAKAGGAELVEVDAEDHFGTVRLAVTIELAPAEKLFGQPTVGLDLLYELEEDR